MRGFGMSDGFELTCFFDSLNLGVVLGVMQIAKRVPFDNPDVLNGVRAMYLASNLIILFIYYLIHSKINKKKGTSYLTSGSAGMSRGAEMFQGELSSKLIWGTQT